MRTKLNSDQAKFMLEHWFSPRDIRKIFDTTSIDWVCEQDFELDGLEDPFVDVYMNGLKYTSIRSSGKMHPIMEKLLNMG